MTVIRSRKRSRLLAVLAVAGLSAALAGCGTAYGDNGFEVPPPPPASGDGGTEGASFQVLSPAEGDTVSLPFDVAIETDVELGAIDDELPHWHIWFDEQDGTPDAVASDTVTLDGVDIPVPEGETTLIVQLHTFDHEPLSDPIEIPLTVDSGSGDDGGNDGDGGNDEGDDGGYGDGGDGGYDDGGGDDGGGYGY